MCTWLAGSLCIGYMGMIIESSNQREGLVWESKYMLLSQALLCFTRMSCVSLLVTVGEHAIAWQGNQKPCAVLVKTGHRVQAMKQAVPLTERVNGEILGNKINNLNQMGF